MRKMMNRMNRPRAIVAGVFFFACALFHLYKSFQDGFDKDTLALALLFGFFSLACFQFKKDRFKERSQKSPAEEE